jgi:hypothetical protein
MVTWSVTCSIGDFPLGFPWAACFGWRTLFSLCLPQRDVNVYDFKGITRIRRENPAFNYGFFRPNPVSFAGIDQKNADHGCNFTRSSEPEQTSIVGQALRLPGL